MLRLKRFLAICLLLLLCFSAAAAEDCVDVTLNRGEHWTVPADRLGACELSDSAVLAFEDGELIGLRPGRAEARFTGERTTVFRVLVLYQAAETAAEEPVPETHPDYRFFAVSDDVEETDDPAGAGEDTDLTDGEPAAGEDEAPEAAPETTDQATDQAADQAPETAPGPEAPAAEDPLEAADPADLTVQAYDRTQVPEPINTVIDFAINEWREAANKTFSRKGSKNKYSYWQCGKGPKCDIGWCGAFLGYVFDTCGIPMDEPTKSVPHDGGEPWSVRAAGVGKINKGFEKMGRLAVDADNRLLTPPRPGYLVVYGEFQRNKITYGYKHIGLVTDVDELGDGRYLLKTVEGNMSNRIKRYCYVYDPAQPIKNTAPCPEEYRVNDGEINDYEHIKTWRITTFCQTWY